MGTVQKFRIRCIRVYTFHVVKHNFYIYVLMWKFCNRLRTHDWLTDNDSTNQKKYWLLSSQSYEWSLFADIPHEKQLFKTQKVYILHMNMKFFVHIDFLVEYNILHVCLKCIKSFLRYGWLKFNDFGGRGSHKAYCPILRLAGLGSVWGWQVESDQSNCFHSWQNTAGVCQCILPGADRLFSRVWSKVLCSKVTPW